MCRAVLKVSAFKVATQEIDLEPFGGEGKLKVRGINTKVTRILAEINEKFGTVGENNALANIEASIAVCENCIVDAPFKIDRETIEDFPPELTEKIVATVLGAKDNKIPLE